MEELSGRTAGDNYLIKHPREKPLLAIVNSFSCFWLIAFRLLLVFKFPRVNDVALLTYAFLQTINSLQTKTHVCLITDYYPGGELFVLLDRQPTKVLKEDSVR